MTPFSIDDWNSTTRAVNQLILNPYEGHFRCTDIPDLLEEVSAPHVWSKGDIKAVRDALLRICPENEFSEELRLWDSAVLTEIGDAISRGFCLCCETKEAPSPLTTYLPATYTFINGGHWCDWAALLNGLEVGDFGQNGTVGISFTLPDRTGATWPPDPWRGGMGVAFNCEGGSIDTTGIDTSGMKGPPCQ